MKHTTYAILTVSLILFTLLMMATSHLAAPVQASEPSLTDVLNYENFTYTGPVSNDTFSAGTYNITMYAEWATYYNQNELYWYPVGGDISNSTLIFTGPQGAQGGMGYVDPPISASFTSSSQFGLSFSSPDSQSPFYTQTSRNLDGTQHAKIYQSTTDSNLYFIGFENMGVLSGSDFDYNDMVVSLEATQVQLTVFSAHDSATPTSGSYAPGTSITASVTSPVAGSTGTQYLCTGWTGTGDVPASGTGTTVTFTITQDSNITWNWKTQFNLTVQTDPSTLVAIPGQGWYDASSSVPLNAPPVTGWNFTYWDVDGVSQGSTNPITVNMNAAHTATAHYIKPLTVSINPNAATTSVGIGVTFTSTVSGGTAPYTYQWYLNGNPVSGATSSSWKFVPTTSGIYYVYVIVTDAASNTAQSGTARVEVLPSGPVGGFSISMERSTPISYFGAYMGLLGSFGAVLCLRKQKRE